jgi:hypothetical protein
MPAELQLDIAARARGSGEGTLLRVFALALISTTLPSWNSLEPWLVKLNLLYKELHTA